jgi:hypothetical protein
VADLANRIGESIPAGQATNSAALLLQLASALIKSHTGQQFDRATETVALTANDSDLLELPQRPVTAVSSVSVDTAALTPTTDFVFDADGSLWRVGTNWTSPYRNTVAVTYTHGYAVDGQGITAVPDDVKQVCLDVVARAVMGRPVLHRATGNPDSEGNAVVQAAREPENLKLTAEDKDTLAHYHRVAVA